MVSALARELEVDCFEGALLADLPGLQHHR
jgi:hypothetical protein